MRLEKFTREHFYAIELQDQQLHEAGRVSESGLDELERADVVTIFDEAGTVLFIGGCFEIWPGRYYFWSLISKHAANRFVRITREVLKYMDRYKHIRRIECYVDPMFSEAQRWASILGFLPEGHMEKWFPGGEDALMYTKINKE